MLQTLFIACMLIPTLADAITARSYVVMDIDGNVLAAQAPDEQRSIASITKLITSEKAAQLDQTELIEITAPDVKAGKMKSSPLKAGMVLTRGQLMQLALVSSDNIAAIALGRTSQLSIALPINTVIVEASGLDAGNKSTAREIAEIARSLYNTELANISIMPTVMVGARMVHSTNPLINQPGWTFYLSKTGFTRPAGGCLVVITKVGERLVIIAILGSKDAHQRWKDLVELRQQLGDSGFYEPSWKHAKRTRKGKR